MNDKTHWVAITSFCNNNCLFCLDGKHKSNIFLSDFQIKKNILEGINNNCSRIVLSGGEASISPNFKEYIKYSKLVGYKHIQTITNGRMFSNELFLDECICAGLDEITFSIHSHRKDIFEQITNSTMSYKQTYKGLINALSKKIIVSCDIVLNKLNIDEIDKTIAFLIKIGLREFDIMQLMPFGSAWKNWDMLYYDIEKKKDKINSAIALCKNNNVVVFTNKIPYNILDNNYDQIQNPQKLYDEIRGRSEQIIERLNSDSFLECYPKRCKYCFLKDLCQFIIDSFKKCNKEEKKLNTKDTIIFSKMDNYYHNKSKIKIIDYYNLKFKNIPFCIMPKHLREKISFEDLTYDKKNFDLMYCTQIFINHIKVKPIKCKDCFYNYKCKGISVLKAKKSGFNQLKPE